MLFRDNPNKKYPIELLVHNHEFDQQHYHYSYGYLSEHDCSKAGCFDYIATNDMIPTDNPLYARGWRYIWEGKEWLGNNGLGL